MTRPLAIIVERTITGATDTECGSCLHRVESYGRLGRPRCMLFGIWLGGAGGDPRARLEMCVEAERAAERLAAMGGA